MPTDSNDRRECIARYGVISDARTGNPVAGARVSLGARITGPDGWYHFDAGCSVRDPFSNFNTTFMSVTHPSYTPLSVIVGRGVHGVFRLDFALEPR